MTDANQTLDQPGGRQGEALFDPAAPKPTAHMVAVLRAVHQLLDRPLVFDDPLALRILGKAAADKLGHTLHAYRDPLLAALRAALVVRSRYVEDAWREAQAQDLRQLVILGAGLDTLAYRADLLQAGTTVFEVDLPATQQWKRQLLHEAGIAAPAHLRYVPLDFERATLAEGLATASFQREAPAFFSCLGVVMYLDRPAIDDTLRFIAGCGKGSRVVFDYCVDLALLPQAQRQALGLVAQKAAEQGEPWKTYDRPDELVQHVRALGFSHAETPTTESLQERYLAHRADGLRLGGATRLLHARV